MNLIERLELMAHNADSYRCMLTNGKVDERHATADREAIETVRAMQEALRHCESRLTFLAQNSVNVAHELPIAREALRRAEGNAG